MLNNIRLFFNDFDKKKILSELLPPLLIVLFITGVLKHIAQSDWSYFMLYHGDSTVLPQLFDSLAKHEHFQWVFSSQTFLYPEALLYGFCNLFSNSVRVVLILNGYLNVLILYTCFRIIVRFTTKIDRIRQVLLVFSMTIIFLLYILMEQTVELGRSSIATPYLFTTYYGGVIISGLTILSLLYSISDGLRKNIYLNKKNIIVLGIIIAICILTTFSNPLFIMQFTLPIVLTAIFVYIFNKVSLNNAVLIILSTLLPSIIGYGLRVPLSKYIAVGVDSYVHPNRIYETLSVIKASLRELHMTWYGNLKAVLITFFAVLPLCFVIMVIYKDARAVRKTTNSSRFFLASFISFTVVIISFGFLATGSITTRYLLPILIFPLLGLVLADGLLAKLPINKKTLRLVVVPVIIFCLLYSGGAVRSIYRMVRGENYTTARCLEEWADGRIVNGVGDFWITRELDLYSTNNITTLQLKHDLTIFDWMINVGSYENKDFSFAIRDHGRSGSLFLSPPIEKLGSPKEIIPCPEYDIYDYTNTEGQNILNKYIRDSLGEIRKSRNF